MTKCVFPAIGLTLIFATITFAEQSPLQRWVARYAGTGSNQDSAKAIAIDNTGNTYVTGNSSNGSNDDCLTVKYSPTGVQLWTARYNGPDNSYDGAYALKVDALGNVYVTGYSSATGAGADYITIKYDTNGNKLWEARYDGPISNFDIAKAISVDNSGYVYVTGYSYGSGQDYATIKYDPNGNELWVARYAGPCACGGEAYAVALDPAGNVYVTGYNIYSHAEDYVTIKYDPNGNQLWAARYDGPANSSDIASALAVDNFGNAYVTGRSIGNGTSYDYATIKYDSTGTPSWIIRYNGAANGNDSATSLAIDDSGNIYVTGGSYGGSTDMDYVSIKYNNAGTQLWEARYTPGYNWPYKLVLDKAQNVYVTGGTGNYMTVKYDSEGNQLWSVSYDYIGGDDWPSDLVADNYGNVYVTGYSVGSGTGADFATIKYTQHNYCAGEVEFDVNHDCKFDFKDFASIASHWLDCNFALPQDCN